MLNSQKLLLSCLSISDTHGCFPSVLNSSLPQEHSVVSIHPPTTDHSIYSRTGALMSLSVRSGQLAYPLTSLAAQGPGSGSVIGTE